MPCDEHFRPNSLATPDDSFALINERFAVEQHIQQDVRASLQNPTGSRCSLFLDFPRRYRASIPFMGLQARDDAGESKKKRNPEGGAALGRLAALQTPYRSTRDMRVVCALPSGPKRLRAARLDFKDSP